MHVEVHHLRHWVDLGPTDLANLTTTCWRHHRMLHEGGWRASHDPDSGRTL